MKPTEHLEHIIGLLGKSTPAEIKGSLLAMHEQLEADERTVADAVRLRDENTALRQAKEKAEAELAALKANPPKPKRPPDIRVNIPRPPPSII